MAVGCTGIMTGYVGFGALAISGVSDFKRVVVQPLCKTLDQIALRFALDTPGVDTIIPGAKDILQLKNNLSILELPASNKFIYTELRNRYGKPNMIFNTGD